MRQALLEIGKIVGTHGVHGEMRVQPWCDTPDFLCGFKRFCLDRDGKNEKRVLSARVHGNIALVKFEGIDTPEQAASLRGRVLFMRREDAHLPEGSVFIADLLGCEAVDADNESKSYGELCDVSQTGANDVWHIRGANGREYLIPAIPDVVVSTDVDNNRVVIRPLKGIFDDED